MKNVRVAFEIYDGNVEDLSSGYQEVSCHIIFNVNMGDNFHRKSLMVAGGHKTTTPSSLTYSSVVSWDSVRIYLTISALNYLNFLACDIQNAYPTTKFREKICTVEGPDSDTEQIKSILVVRALYVMKSSGAAFRFLLAEHLHDLCYRPSIADPDVWMRPAVKPGGSIHYEYII